MSAALRDQLDRLRALVARGRRAYEARVPRERLLLVAAAAGVLWMAGDSLWLGPAQQRWVAARARDAAAEAQVRQIESDLAQRVRDVSNAERQLGAEVAQWRTRIATGEAELRALGTGLVSAQQMVPMLDRLLGQVSGLELRSMQSLGRHQVEAAAGARAASAPADTRSAGVLYRHGVEVTVEGRYADVLAYLRALEAMPQRVLWGGLQLSVERHPKVVLTLRLYTLSEDSSWLEI